MKFFVKPDLKLFSQSLYEAVEKANDGDEIILSEGTYYLTKPLHIQNKQISIYSSRGERATLVGGIPVQGWEEYKNGIYKVKVSQLFHALYENNKRCESARYPKKGYVKSKGRVEENNKRAILFDQEDIPNIQDHGDIKCCMWPGGPLGEWNWQNVDMPAVLDVEKRILTLCQDTRYELGAGTRYYIHNSLELLTEPGEYFLDKEERILYYKPFQMPIEQQEIIMPLMKNIIEIEDSNSVCIKEIDIKYTDTEDMIYAELEGQDSGAIYIKDAENIVLKDLRISNTGMNGVSLNKRAKNITVTGCHIYHIGHTGIRAMGEWISDQYMNKGHVFTNNHIHHLGERVGHSAGIQLIQCGDSYILHNRIHHSKRYAISMKSPSLGEIRKKYDVIDNPWSHQRKKYSFSKNNTIAFNELFHCNTDSQDTGLIEAWCPGEYNKIQNNMIHHSEVPFSFAFAIYLDDECDYFTVENNVIHNMNHFGKGNLLSAIAVKGIGNVVKNNIVANCNVSKSGGVLWIPGRVNGGENFDITAEENIYYQSGNGIVYCERWEIDSVKEMKNNLYFNQEKQYQFKGLYGKKGGVNYHKWTQAGYDHSSMLVDPRFVDPEKNDFRLVYDSPAYKLSIQDINLRDIGLTTAYKGEEPSPIEKIFVWVDGHKSYYAMKSGEKAKLNCMARTENGMVIMPENVIYTVASKVISIDKDGIITAHKKGIAQVNVQAGVVSTVFWVLIDDYIESVELVGIEKTAVLGEKYQAKVVGITGCGRYIQPEQFAIYSDNNMIAGDTLFMQAAGKDRITVKAVFEAEAVQQDFTIDVQEDALKDIQVTLPSVSYVGEAIQAELKGILFSGRTIKLEEVGLRGEQARLEGDTLIIDAEGEHKLEFYVGSISETLYIRGVNKTEISEEWECKSYGEATGLVKEDGKISLYSNGKNIWYRSDDFTYYYKWMESDGCIEVDMTVLRVEEVDPDTQGGILIRAEDAVDSRCVNLRVTPEGKIMLCARLENGGEMKPYAGALSSCRFGAGDGNQLGTMEGAAGQENAFPVTLRLTYQEGKAQGFIKTEEGYVKLGEVHIEMPQRCMAGAALFSIDTNHCAGFSFYVEV